MVCNKCSGVIPDDSTFCYRCGNNISEAASAEEVQPLCDGAAQNVVVTAEKNGKAKGKKKKDRKKKKKSAFVRFLIVILVLFMAFNAAKAVVFFIDFGGYIFVNKSDCGMRDKDELIDSFIETILNNEDVERYRLTTYPLVDKEALKDELEEATSTDFVKLAKMFMVAYNYYFSVTEMLETESFNTRYSFISTDTDDIEEVRDELEYIDVDEDDIEKAERYTIKITCRGNNGNKVTFELYLNLVRISRTWYAYSWSTSGLVKEVA